MRHIPEDELHAYLDQGLSRGQCVEIESHLAACPSCRAARDGIAALRDRTTALLARLAPPRGVPPAFDVLRGRAEAHTSARRRRISVAAWAASLLAAMGLGWSASTYLHPGLQTAPASDTPMAAAPPRQDARQSIAAPPTAPAPTRTASVTERRDMGDPPVPRRRFTREVVAPSDDSATTAARRAAALSVLNPTPALELSRLESPTTAGDVELDGMWRTMSWDGARAEAGTPLPHIDGLPVVRVQVQSGELGPRPVTVVVQQLVSGQVIRTIEGPASDVSQLLSRRSIAGADSLFVATEGEGTTAGRHAMAMQVGDRMIAITGDLPSDSLRAMIRRLNAELRTK